ncbi:branched-chain amino acid ABC transporter permease [Algihabitans sp.]|uniref:branched-chain amino acid ABC transporter permease n=1 Tax=Algihabitans sp. TaxID=2821514 RepID=UPI003BAD48C4
MAELLQLILFGLVLGSILTLGAIGLSLTYGILKFAHFAHGDFLTLGAYFALSLIATAQLPILVSIPIAALATLLVALIADRLIYRRLRRTQPVILLIASVGVALILRSAVQIIWGPNVQVYVQGIQLPYVIPFGDGAIRIKPDHLVIMGGALVLVTSLHFFLQYTRVGKAMRAMSDNPDLARVTGIDTEKVVLWTWGIGIALAAVGGIFAGLDAQLHPNLGWQLLLPIFAAAILGGIGKPYGAIAGGMTIGLAQELSTLVIPPEYKPAVSFGIMVLVLIVRPRGIFAGSST